MRTESTLIIGLLLLTTVFCRAQGIMPPLNSSAPVLSTAPVTTLLIGERVPDTAVVVDEHNRPRTLLSFKAPLEILVIYVFSGNCDAEQAAIPRYRMLYKRYQEWRVAFVEIRNGRPAAESPWNIPKVTDPTTRIHRLLGVEGTPMMLIVDEGGILRYRGMIDEKTPFNASAQKALEDTIGHIEPVKDPEPNGTFLCPAP